MRKEFGDIFYFGRIISIALLICGYIVLGIILGRKLVEKGFPEWVLLVCVVFAAFFGLSQGWVLIKKSLKH